MLAHLTARERDTVKDRIGPEKKYCSGPDKTSMRAVRGSNRSRRADDSGESPTSRNKRPTGQQRVKELVGRLDDARMAIEDLIDERPCPVMQDADLVSVVRDLVDALKDLGKKPGVDIDL